MNVLEYIQTRMLEASTWRGVIYIATAAGLKVSPDQATAIVTLGLAVAGFISVFFPDKPKGA